MRKRIICGILAAVMVLAAGCSPEKEGGKRNNVDLNSMKMEEIISMAQEEGEINSVGMPDGWANWEGIWAGIGEKYGLIHTDVDLTSAEELAMFEAEKNKATKDTGDVGIDYGKMAEKKGLTQKYKTSYWDSIPEWAKDDDGDWIVEYTGTMALVTNKTLVPEPPRSFQDILEGDYQVCVGDVAKASGPQYAVLSVARAFGGDEGNVEPALKFFRTLAEQGRLDKGELNFYRIEKGEIPVAFTWDFAGLGYKDAIIENNPEADFEVHIPEEGSVQTGYCTIINAYTVRPHAAAAAREYILSDEGQLKLVEGHAKPIRDIKIPEELRANLLMEEEYGNIYQIQDEEAWRKTVEQMGVLWQEEVMAYAK